METESGFQRLPKVLNYKENQAFNRCDKGQPQGKSLKFVFDSSHRLVLHGSKVTSDAGLPAEILLQIERLRCCQA